MINKRAKLGRRYRNIAFKLFPIYEIDEEKLKKLIKLFQVNKMRSSSNQKKKINKIRRYISSLSDKFPSIFIAYGDAISEELENIQDDRFWRSKNAKPQ